MPNSQPLSLPAVVVTLAPQGIARFHVMTWYAMTWRKVQRGVGPKLLGSFSWKRRVQTARSWHQAVAVELDGDRMDHVCQTDYC